MRRRGFESWKAVAWALSPVIGLFGIVLSATYLFGICNWDSLRCAMPVSPQILPSSGSAHYTAPQPTSAEIDANTRAQAVADDNQRRTLAVNKCVNEKLNFWKTQNPDADQKQGLARLLEISKECLQRFPSVVVAQADASVLAQPNSGRPRPSADRRKRSLVTGIIDIQNVRTNSSTHGLRMANRTILQIAKGRRQTISPTRVQPASTALHQCQAGRLSRPQQRVTIRSIRQL